MSKKDDSRMESNYVEAALLIKNCKTGLIGLIDTAEILITNVTSRLVWIEQQNAIDKAKASAKGLPTPQPLDCQTEINNLERLTNLMVVLNNPGTGLQGETEAQRTMLAMAAMLRQAREEYNEDTKAEEATEDTEEIESVIKEEIESEEFNQRHGIHTPSTDSHRRCEQRKKLV